MELKRRLAAGELNLVIRIKKVYTKPTRAAAPATPAPAGNPLGLRVD